MAKRAQLCGTHDDAAGARKRQRCSRKVFKYVFTDAQVVAWATEACAAPFVRDLSLHNCPITDASLLAVGAHCTELRTLSLYRCDRVTDAGVTALVWDCSELQSCFLNGCNQITDASVEALASQCAELDVASFCDCPNITDAGVLKLATACPLLQVISLWGCLKITDTSLAVLAQHCAELRKVSLRGCDVTLAAVEALRAALPGCIVVH